MTGYLSFEVMFSVSETGFSDNDMKILEIRDITGISEAREIAVNWAADHNTNTKTYTIYEIVNVF